MVKLQASQYPLYLRESVSDNYVTKNSGILRQFLPGDIVLADRGFDIADSVGFYRAEPYIPAFTKGTKQLSAQKVEETRKIDNVRIQGHPTTNLL